MPRPVHIDVTERSWGLGTILGQQFNREALAAGALGSHPGSTADDLGRDMSAGPGLGWGERPLSWALHRRGHHKTQLLRYRIF